MARPSRVLQLALLLALLVAPIPGMVAVWMALREEGRAWRWVGISVVFALMEGGFFGLLEAASWVRQTWGLG